MDKNLYKQMLATSMILALDDLEKPASVNVMDNGIHVEHNAGNKWLLNIQDDCIKSIVSELDNHEIPVSSSTSLCVAALSVSDIFRLTEFLTSVLKETYIIQHIARISLGLGSGDSWSITYNKPMLFIKAVRLLAHVPSTVSQDVLLAIDAIIKLSKPSETVEGQAMIYYSEVIDGITHTYAYEPDLTQIHAVKAPVRPVLDAVHPVNAVLVPALPMPWVDASTLMPVAIAPYVTKHHSAGWDRVCYSIAVRYLISLPVHSDYLDYRVVWFVAHDNPVDSNEVESDIAIVRSAQDIDLESFTDPEAQNVCYHTSDFKDEAALNSGIRESMLKTIRRLLIKRIKLEKPSNKKVAPVLCIDHLTI